MKKIWILLGVVMSFYLIGCAPCSGNKCGKHCYLDCGHYYRTIDEFKKGTNQASTICVNWNDPVPNCIGFSFVEIVANISDLNVSNEPFKIKTLLSTDNPERIDDITDLQLFEGEYDQDNKYCRTELNLTDTLDTILIEEDGKKYVDTSKLSDGSCYVLARAGIKFMVPKELADINFQRVAKIHLLKDNEGPIHKYWEDERDADFLYDEVSKTISMYLPLNPEFTRIHIMVADPSRYLDKND